MFSIHNYPTFSGEEGESGRRWVRAMNILPSVTPRAALQLMDGHLQGKAAKWADLTPEITAILDESYIINATKADRKMFEEAISERFKGAQEIDVELEMQSLYQKTGESIKEYYQCATDVLAAANIQDRREGVTLSESEESILEMVIDKFIQGIHDAELRARLSDFNKDSRFGLRGIYLATEDVGLQLRKDREVEGQLRRDKYIMKSLKRSR